MEHGGKNWPNPAIDEYFINETKMVQRGVAFTK
jgi:hypothetical protein